MLSDEMHAAGGVAHANAQARRATPEQAVVVDDDIPDFWLIRGAAGSGKTTTALLRLRFLVKYWRDRREDLGLVGPVRVLVLTFNRTLRGYIEELAREQIQSGPEVDLEVSTFGAWSQALLGRVILDQQPRAARISQFAGGRFPWSDEFLVGEVDYALGRWMPADRSRYLAADRTGRGAAPRVDGAQRGRLIEQVITPYEAWKADRGVVDWNDLAVYLAANKAASPYDVIVVDETQDFSANQIRAIVNHVAEGFVCTFVRDTTQRIYANYFTWKEVGVDFGAQGSPQSPTEAKLSKHEADRCLCAPAGGRHRGGRGWIAPRLHERAGRR